MTKAAIPVLCIIVIFSVFGGLLIYMQTSPRFDIARIGIKGHFRLLPESIVEYLDIQPHTNIFRIRLDTIRDQLNAMQWVKTANVYRNFPNKLSITITERTPFALIKLDELHLVDQDGVVLGSLASGSAIQLPIITGAFMQHIDLEGENPRLGQALHAIDELMHSSNPLFKDLRKIQIESPENVTFFSTDALPKIRMSLVNYEQHLQHFEKIYPDLHPEDLASIDLRFDKRIIVTPKNS